MPQLDFQNAFATEGSTRCGYVDLTARASEYSAPLEDYPSHEKPLRGHRTDRVTLLLAVFTALGGLTCAIYFFNGAEALWKIFSSPRESFYGKPTEFATPRSVQLGLVQKHVDPRLAAQSAGKPNVSSAGRSSNSAIPTGAPGTSGALAPNQNPAANTGVASAAALVSRVGSTTDGVTSKVASTLNSTRTRAATLTRKKARTAKKVAKKAALPAAKNIAQSTTQNSPSAATQATTTISLRSGFGSGFGSSSGFGSGVGGGVGSGLSGAAGGALGGRR